MVLDVAAVGFRALEHCRQEKIFGGDYTFFVSSSPATTMPKVQEMFQGEFPSADIHYITDRGRNFDEHFNDCYRQLFDLGYHAVVCIGGDLPMIRSDMINRAFRWLSQLEKKSGSGGMVLAPCQEGGVSLVGITKETKIDFRGVFYNTDGVTALDGIMNIAIRNRIPTALLETLSDVDDMEDLGHTITVINAMAYAAEFQPEIIIPSRTIAFIQQAGLFAFTQPTEAFDPRSKIDG
jgi:2-phospho-L-lactate guanylyltransferase (CobY/MobA/RfbA family)